MKIFKTILFLLGFLAVTVSCVKDEPLNTECDITKVILPADILNREPEIYNDSVSIQIKAGVDVTNLAPEFELTPGATISPASGTPRNFETTQYYTVTSQDGKWHKTYAVVVSDNAINLSYDFENIRLVTNSSGSATYDVFYEVDDKGLERWAWASANAAFVMTGKGTDPNTFPTYQGDEGVNGKCAVLVTRSTGPFGKLAKKPLAAGNLFMGMFDMNGIPLDSALLMTKFGRPFSKIPLALSGNYKYTPGETYCERASNGDLVPVEGKTDMFNLYAVMFEVEDGKEYLNGTNVLSADNPQIICTAEIPDRKASEEWVYFNVPFTYREGKSIDPDKLKNGQYSIAVVMSSSQDGDYFSGAIGSTLMVDEITLVCEDSEDEN